MTQDTYNALLQYAFRLLGRRNYTEAEMKTKLMRRGEKLKLPHAEQAITKVIKRLKELRYLDDAKILSDYFEYRLQNRPHGKFAFLHIMHRRGISFEIARAEWEKRGIEEESLANALLSKKEELFTKLPDVLRKKKIAQLLTSRGFSSETVWGILEKK